MKHLFLFTVATLVTALLFFIEPAMASPGGKIASAVFNTFWGRIILVGLVIFFLPLIIYNEVREQFAKRRALQDLRFMMKHDAQFDWLTIRNRVTDCFYRVHSGWSKSDLSDTSDWMTDWYWQNQQLVYLDDWERKGLENVCHVKKLKSVQPLLFVHRNVEQAHEQSLLVVSIQATMQDYLQEKATGKVLEGDKRYKEVYHLWSFVLEGGEWKVSNIEEISHLSDYLKWAKQLPKIEDTVVSQPRT